MVFRSSSVGAGRAGIGTGPASAKSELSPRNSAFVLTMFWMTLLCQLSALKYIWGFAGVARAANITSVVLLGAYAVSAVLLGKHSHNVWKYYVFPGLLVLAGLVLNISLNVVSNWALVSYFGSTIAWAAYLSVPLLLRQNTIDSHILWRHYYYFMLAASVSGVIEYVLVFSGISAMRTIESPYGVFLAGSFSLLYPQEGGIADDRLYAWFVEPGSFAMYLLPALSYAYFHRRYVGLFVFLVAGFLTYSLGGFFGAVMLAVIVGFVSLNRRSTDVVKLCVVCTAVAAVLWVNFGDYATAGYENKNNSRVIREDNAKRTIAALPSLIVSYPLGFELAVDTETAERNESYYGSNFIPGNYLQTGGLSAFLGYLLCLAVSFWTAATSLGRKDLSSDARVVFSSIIVLLPFIFQRAVIWDSAIFAFLFAPTVIGVLQRAPRRVRQASLASMWRRGHSGREPRSRSLPERASHRYEH